MTASVLNTIYFSLLLVTAAYAFGRGGRPERALAFGTFIHSIVYYVATIGSGFRSVEIDLLFLDVGLLGFYLWIALCSNRYWPLAVSALQLDCTVAHFARAGDEAMRPWSYALLVQVWTWLIAIVILGATAYHHFHVRRGRARRDWCMNPMPWRSGR